MKGSYFKLALVGDGYQQGELEGADVNAPGRGGSGKGELGRGGAYEGGRGLFFLRYQNR